MAWMAALDGGQMVVMQVRLPLVWSRPDPGALIHPDPGAHGLTRTRGQAHPDPGTHGLTRTRGQAHPDPGARGPPRTRGQAHPDPGARGPPRTRGQAHPDPGARGPPRTRGQAHPDPGARGPPRTRGQAHPDPGARPMMDKFSKDIECSDDEFYFENEEKTEKCNSDESEFSEDASGDDEQIAGLSGTTERKKSLALPKDLAESTDSDSDIEFIKAKRRRTIVYSSESDGDIGDIIENSGIRPSESYVSRGKQEKEKWTSTSVSDKEPSRIPFSTGQLHVGPQVPSGCATPIDFFQLFFTETLIKNITDETNEYARHKISQKELSQQSTWNNWKDVRIEEMKAFLGVILNMGVLNLPNLQSYWFMDFESHIPFFSICFQKRKVLANILDVTLEKQP
ncbi:hypothetical protein QTO34_018449 [Cnephaeus nilssonii]|uniref:PiggyBac transposable element-derived protein domain-containing protein n=1 Tax=Cnephaeus nilssonii TaxID=3371016 RepID=A0AA40HYU9_CNENI|nr:hypothetical protein QTO34_018449 [Eptesicus nilssonii]